jgi:hypothetical protein
MNEGDECGVSGIDAEEQKDRQESLDRGGDIHPELRRFEAGGDVKFQGLWYRELADDMRDEEQRAGNAQQIEPVQQIEFVGQRHAPPGGLANGRAPGNSHLLWRAPRPGRALLPTLALCRVSSSL